MTINDHRPAEHDSPSAWFVRLLKGALIGIGAILPGLSGGVLMVIFRVYDPLLDFLGHFPRFLKRYMRFFIPIGIGGLLGILVFSGAVTLAFGTYAAQFISLFIGFVVGTVPGIWKTAGLEGRGTKEYTALGIAALAVFFMMLNGETEITEVDTNFLTWIGSGLLVGLGFVVPGLSPSNFLIYLGLYAKMTDGIARFDLSVILPLMLGVLIAVLLFAKLVSRLFERSYGVMYHIILGTVVGSSIAIFPTVVLPGLTDTGLAASGLSAPIAILLIAIMFVIGLVSSLLFGRLEARYSPETRL